MRKILCGYWYSTATIDLHCFHNYGRRDGSGAGELDTFAPESSTFDAARKRRSPSRFYDSPQAALDNLRQQTVQAAPCTWPPVK